MNELKSVTVPSIIGRPVCLLSPSQRTSKAASEGSFNMIILLRLTINICIYGYLIMMGIFSLSFN